MKNLISLAIIGALLMACGGGERSDETSPALQTVSEQKKGFSVAAPAAVLGERRSYDLLYVAPNNLTGKTRALPFLDFSLVASEVRLQDISLAFDKDTSAGKLYRLYRAAFGRTPDVRGYGYWKHALESGTITFDKVAEEFLNSSEFRTIYGTDSDDVAYVTRLYKNVLGRVAAADEIQYWVNAIKNGGKRVTVLLEFAGSAENIALSAAAAARGMPFAEPNVAYVPVSNATGPSDVTVNAPFFVDGRTSTDANDDKLTYVWTITSKPSTSTAARILTPDAAMPQLSFDVPGQYEVILRVSDPTSESISAAKLKITAYSGVADTGAYLCRIIDASTAFLSYSQGHRYLDRDGDGRPCTAADIAYELNPPVPKVLDSGIYKCSAISHAFSVTLYLQGHTYLDRDNDGKPCEATDIARETVYVPPVTSPKMCYVSGYKRANGTYVSGYWRRC